MRSVSLSGLFEFRLLLLLIGYGCALLANNILGDYAFDRYYQLLLPNPYPEAFYFEELLRTILGVYALLTSGALFIASYRLFGKTFPERGGRIIITVILGALLADLLGSISLTPVSGGFQWNFSLLSSLPAILLGRYPFNLAISSTITLVLLSVSLGSIVGSWNRKLEKPEGVRKLDRLRETTFTSLLYLVFGVIALCLLPLLSFLTLIMPPYYTPFRPGMVPLFFTLLIPLLLISSGVQILIAYGLYNGRRWGWIASFVAATTILVASVESTVATLWLQAQSFPPYLDWKLFGTVIVSLGLSLVLFLLLLRSPTRSYCRMENPSPELSQADEESPVKGELKPPPSVEGKHYLRQECFARLRAVA